jgi:hypothetical protein
MQHYDPYRRSPRRQPIRTLTIDQIKQTKATLQELDSEAAKWKDLARKWETTATYCRLNRSGGRTVKVQRFCNRDRSAGTERSHF